MGLSNNLGKLSNMITSTGSAVSMSGTLTLATTQYIGNLQFGTASAATLGYDAGAGLMSFNIGAGAVAASPYYQFSADGSARVTILKGGNVGIGTTSPNTWGTNLVIYNNQLTITGGGYDGSFADSIFFGGNSEGTNYRNKISNSLSSNVVNQKMKFSIASGAATFVDVMTLVGNGNVGIGTGSPARKFVVQDTAADPFISIMGAYPNQGGILFGDVTYTDASCAIRIDRNNNALWFSTSGASSERMRITNTDVLVGTTTNTINSSNFGVRLSTDGTLQNSRNAGGSSGVMNVYGNAGQMLVYGNGNIQNTNGSYGTISDLRLKDNITDSTNKLEDLLKVRIVNYNLKEFPEQKLIGVVAQELEKIFPALIEENEDGYKGVKYSIFVPMLIKAMQEMNQQNQDLKSRLDKAGL